MAKIRELKFRAWNRGKMNSDVWNVFFQMSMGNHIGNEDFIPMQYTGIKDKNGKEIYEGDIVNEGDNYYSVVEWNDHVGGPGFFLHEYYPNGENDRYHDFHAYTTYPYEVIGNIYENPELLEVEE